jgi:hypothetical protein
LTDNLDAEQITDVQRSIETMARPLSADDISALISALSAAGDTAFGLNWSILNLVETAPEWPLWDMLRDEGNDWVHCFRQRLANASFEVPRNLGSRPN